MTDLHPIGYALLKGNTRLDLECIFKSLALKL